MHITDPIADMLTRIRTETVFRTRRFKYGRFLRFRTGFVSVRNSKVITDRYEGKDPPLQTDREIEDRVLKPSGIGRQSVKTEMRSILI